MPDVIEQLRGELREAVAGRPALEPAAYARIARRAARRRAATRAFAAATLAVAFAAVLAVPRYLGPSLDRSDTAGHGEGARPAAAPYLPPCEPALPARGAGIAPGGGSSIEASKGEAGRS